MWFRRKPVPPEESPRAWVDRRAPIRWCATCRTGAGPFVYLENGKHYCRPCALRAFKVMRLRPGGRRSDDVA